MITSLPTRLITSAWPCVETSRADSPPILISSTEPPLVVAPPAIWSSSCLGLIGRSGNRITMTKASVWPSLTAERKPKLKTLAIAPSEVCIWVSNSAAMFSSSGVKVYGAAILRSSAGSTADPLDEGAGAAADGSEVPGSVVAGGVDGVLGAAWVPVAVEGATVGAPPPQAPIADAPMRSVATPLRSPKSGVKFVPSHRAPAGARQGGILLGAYNPRDAQP